MLQENHKGTLGSRKFKADKPFDGRYQFCAEMVRDPYFPDFLVEKVQGALQAFADWVSRDVRTYKEIQARLDEMVETINALAEEFEENGSEIETVARESIGGSVAYVLQWFGIEIDIEDAIGARDW